MPADCKCKPEINMKRIFIAVKINAGKNLLHLISDLKTGLKDERIKWTEIENFHITIAFLGDTEEDKIKAINKMLKSDCERAGVFEIVIKGAGVFKNFNDPRILWAGIEPSEKLYHLYESVKSGLKDTGISLDERNFKPHLTLGRIKSIQDCDTLKTIIDGYKNLELQKQVVNEVILYESLLFHSGPVYKPLGRFGLGSK
jgi:RNA 2',3'-cyclic 3'-phosphodiesterase